LVVAGEPTGKTREDRVRVVHHGRYAIFMVAEIASAEGILRENRAGGRQTVTKTGPGGKGRLEMASQWELTTE
jgi:hypothetical protein